MEIEAGKLYQIPFYLADHALWKAEAETVPRVLVRLQTETIEEGDPPGLSLNGHPLEPMERGKGEAQYPVSAGWLKTGYNLFQVFAGGPSRTQLKDILIEVRYQH